MSNVHFILQGKGGVGKSFVAAVMSQYLNDAGRDLMIIDTDPINRTLAGFSGLHAHEIHLMTQDNDIDASLFDKLLEDLVLEHDGDSLIDNGASSFVSLSGYLIRNQIVDFLEENEKRVVIHIPLTGGQALFDTLSGMNSIITQYPESCSFVVWLNEFQGPVSEEESGKTFTQMKAYKQHESSIAGIVKIPKQEELFDRAVKLMMKQRMTFEEVKFCEDTNLFNRLQKRRIGMFKTAIWKQMDALSQEGVL